jgi:hypothetical protein
MKLQNIVLIIALLLAALVLYFTISPVVIDTPVVENATAFNVLEIGRSQSVGYVVYSYRGDPQVKLLSYKSQPLKEVTILNESDSMGDAGVFLADLKELEDYGFSLKVSNDRILGDGIFIVPTGAIPSYVLDDLRFNATEAIVVYVGKSDLILRNGIKKEDWYDQLDEFQKKRIILYNHTPEEFQEAEKSLFIDVLENKWSTVNSINTTVSGHGKHTSSIDLKGGSYIRLIYSVGAAKGVVDSLELPSSGISISASPQSIFLWEKSTVSFNLNKTNGTAALSVWKDAGEVSQESLKRVTDENFFLKRLSFEEPGKHLIRISDNSGVIGSAIIHVKNLDITYLDSMGTTYRFNVEVDGVPLNNEKVMVNLANSTNKKEYIISEGILSVPARLSQGKNLFNIELLGTKQEIEVNYTQEGIADIYLKYGLPGLLIVLAVFFGARMSRRPVYTLRVGEVAGEVRKDVAMPTLKAIESFKSIRSELGIGKNPITAHEFSIALKRHVTDGADVTEGNVEEILQHLVKSNHLQSHRQYYQLKGEGDIRKNALVRMIRDMLIEAGINFKMKGKRFVSEHYEIGFFGDKFNKKAMIIVEDNKELDSIMNSLSKAQLAQIKIMISNGILQFVTIDRLENVL